MAKNQDNNSQDVASMAAELPNQRANVESMVRRLPWPLVMLFNIIKHIPYFGFHKAVAFEKALAHMTKGTDILEWWSQQLMLNVEVEGVENLPKSGAVMLCCNHPTGLSDGIAVWEAIKKNRPDFRIMLNSQSLDSIPVFQDLVVPVHLKNDGETRDRRNMWRHMLKTMRAQMVVMTCPAGRLSQLDWFGDWDIHDLPWKNGLEKMQKSFPETVFLPVYIEGRLHKRYYLLHKLFPAMRDFLLYTEFHSRKNWTMKVKILPPVQGMSALDVQRLVESNKTTKWFKLPREITKRAGSKS